MNSREDFIMFKKNLKKRAALGIIVLAVALAFGGCNQKGLRNVNKAPAYESKLTVQAAGATADYGDYDYEYTETAEEYEPGGGMDGAQGDGVVDNGNGTIVDPGAAQNRKLIRTVDLEVETKEYDNLMKDVEKKIEELGGYIENEYSYNGSSYGGGRDTRYATMVIRIPDNKLNDFVTTMAGISNVISKRTSAQDVTLQYTDIESKRDMYKAEQESLMALLEKAQTVEDITYLTQRLTEVRYSIESMERQLRVYDNQVDYATINLDIHEVEILTPQVIDKKTDAEEMKEGLAASWASIGNAFKNFGKAFVINLPYIIIVFGIVAIHAIAALIVISNVKKKYKKTAGKKSSKESTKESEKISVEETAEEETSAEEAVEETVEETAEETMEE